MLSHSARLGACYGMYVVSARGSGGVGPVGFFRRQQFLLRRPPRCMWTKPSEHCTKQRSEPHRFNGGPGHANHLLQPCIQACFEPQNQGVEPCCGRLLECILLTTHVHLHSNLTVFQTTNVRNYLDEVSHGVPVWMHACERSGLYIKPAPLTKPPLRLLFGQVLVTHQPCAVLC